MKSNRKSLLIGVLIIFSLLIIFLAPFGYHIDLGPGPNTITAILWEYSTENSFRYLVALQYYVESYIFRFIVLFGIVRFFQGKMSKKWLIILTIIAELIPLIFAIPASLILNSEGENLTPIIIPIPILLIFIIIMAHFFPKLKTVNFFKNSLLQTYS